MLHQKHMKKILVVGTQFLKRADTAESILQGKGDTLDILERKGAPPRVIPIVTDLLLELHTPEDVVDPPCLGQHGAKEQG